MLESFYFPFDPLEYWEAFITEAFFFGFMILLGTSILIALIFYFILCRDYKKASRLTWFFTLLLNSVLIFVNTASAVGYGALQGTEGFAEFPTVVWVFAAWNATVYSWVVYTIFSLGINNFSKHGRFVPFNLFRK